MKNFKKVVAIIALTTLVLVNSASADLTLTQSWATNLTLTWSADISGGLSVNGSLNVWVTAKVLPLLTMDLSKSTLDFGDLVVGTPNVQSLDVTTATNAKNWVVVTVWSTWLATGWDTTDKYIGALSRGTATATTGTDSYSISSSTTTGWDVLTESNVNSTQTILTANNVAKANAVTTVNLKTVIDAQTEAWNYADTLTFTVTWNF